MTNVLAGFGMFVVLAGIFGLQYILRNTNLSEYQKGRINIIAFTFVTISMGTLSYVVFL